MASLGDTSVGFAVRSSLTQRQMSEYYHEALADTIVRRLSELHVEEKHRANINARTNNHASPSAAFLATDANIPKLNKDTIKNARRSCAICGKTGHIQRSSASPTSSHPAPRRLVGRRWAPLSTISTTLYLLARNPRRRATAAATKPPSPPPLLPLAPSRHHPRGHQNAGSIAGLSRYARSMRAPRRRSQ